VTGTVGLLAVLGFMPSMMSRSCFSRVAAG
jgi:hypothetical protein